MLTLTRFMYNRNLFTITKRIYSKYLTRIQSGLCNQDQEDIKASYYCLHLLIQLFWLSVQLLKCLFAEFSYKYRIY